MRKTLKRMTDTYEGRPFKKVCICEEKIAKSSFNFPESPFPFFTSIKN